MNGLAILGAILGAGGGISRGMGAVEKEQIAREELERQKANDALKADLLREELALKREQMAGQNMPTTDFYRLFGQEAPAGGPAMIRNDFAEKLAPIIMAQRAKEAEQAQALKSALFIDQAKTGGPAQLAHPLGAGEDPEAAALIPRQSGPMGVDDMAAGLRARGEKSSDIVALLKLLRPEAEGTRYAAIPENAAGLYDTRTGQTTQFEGRQTAAPTGPPEVPPGMQLVTNINDKGRTSYSLKPMDSGVERDSMAVARGFPSFAAAPRDVQNGILKHIDDQTLRRQQDTGLSAAKLNAKPLDAEAAKELGSATIALAAVRQLKSQFSLDEASNYIGMLNRPMAETQQRLAGVGIGNADKRFADFKALTGRIQKSMFDSAGKALTPMEKEITYKFIPTGEEANGTEFMAKLNGYEAFTQAARQLQLELTRTGRGQVNWAEYDSRLQEIAAGLGGGGTPHPSWSGGGTPATGGGWKIQRVR